MRFKKTQNKPADIDTIVGDAHKDVNSSSKTKLSRLGTKKKIAIIFIIILIISCVAAALYIYFQDTESETSKADLQAQKSINNIINKVENGLPENPNPQQTNEFYVSALWLKLREDDYQGVANLYLNEVKPLNLSLATDLKEGIVAALIDVKNNQEAKILIASILADYKNASSAGDPNTAKYIQLKIDKYSSMEQNL